jgi:hypothetical protein
MRWPLLLCLGLAGACSQVDLTLDSDGDGLTDAEEAELGTDPFATDSDGDEFSDQEEVASGTDPLQFHDHPYYGGWPKDACAEDIVASGTHQVGDVAEDFLLLDQFGKAEKVRLYDFCDQTVLLVSSAFG